MTTVARSPREATPWTRLAETLAAAGRHEDADAAWAEACAAEPTHAGHLRERIEHLLAQGRRVAARPLLRRLAEGPWQDRFRGHQGWARRRLSR